MRRMPLAAIVAALFLLGAAQSALALTGSPVTVATGQSSGPPSVAVRADGTAVIAWANTAPTPNVVQWCVLPVAAAACSASGQLSPAGNAGFVDSVSVLDEGSSLNILAGVHGATDPTTYETVQEWQSTDGATFLPVNGGQAVASGDPSGLTQPIGAVTLPGDSGLGFGFMTATSAPSFRAVSLTAPTTCGRGPAACPDGFATLQPAGDLDQVSNPASTNFAANQTGVMGIFGTNFTSGSLGCSGSLPFGTAYVFGVGAQSATNNYDISPGQANSAWRQGITQGDCNVEYPAVGAGPSGFGVLEQNDVTGHTQYHRFDPTSGFSAAPVAVSTLGERDPAVSQDAAGGVYATYLSDDPAGRPVSLSYSFDGGTTWSGPNTLVANPGAAENFADLTSSVNGTGQGWAAWVNGTAVVAQRFDKTDSIPPAAATSLTTTQTAGKQSGTALSIAQGTVGETDRATIAGANAAYATGTITYTLYSTSSCRPASAILKGAPQPVAGPLAPASVPVGLLLAPGSYYWQAVYSGNAGSAVGALGNLPSVSACDESLRITPATVISASATSDGRTMAFGAGCAAVPCTIKVTVTSSGAAKTAAKKSKTITLGSGTFRIKKKGTRKLTLALSKAGRSYLARKRGKVKLALSVSQKVRGHRVVNTKTITVKVRHPKR